LHPYSIKNKRVKEQFTDVSEVIAASIIKAIALIMEAQQPRRQPSSYSPP
jgi:hypothetical protein